MKLRRTVVWLGMTLLCSCATMPRESPVVTTSWGDFGSVWIFVGSESGYPVSREAANSLMARWRSEAESVCAGSFIGDPLLQITALARPGQPFADPYAASTRRIYSAALGHAHCTSMVAATDP